MPKITFKEKDNPIQLRYIEQGKPFCFNGETFYRADKSNLTASLHPNEIICWNDERKCLTYFESDALVSPAKVDNTVIFGRIGAGEYFKHDGVIYVRDRTTDSYYGHTLVGTRKIFSDATKVTRLSGTITIETD